MTCRSWRYENSPAVKPRRRALKSWVRPSEPLLSARRQAKVPILITSPTRPTGPSATDDSNGRRPGQARRAARASAVAEERVEHRKRRSAAGCPAADHPNKDPATPLPATARLEDERDAGQRRKQGSDPPTVRREQFAHGRYHRIPAPTVTASDTNVARATAKRVMIAFTPVPPHDADASDIGDRAVSCDGRIRDPWLCVPASQRVCPERSVTEAHLASRSNVRPRPAGP